MASNMQDFLAGMQEKVDLAKQQVGDFRIAIRDATLEEAALRIETAGGMNSAAFAEDLRSLISADFNKEFDHAAD